MIESDRDSVFVPLLTVGRQTQLDGDCSLGSFECIGPTGRATFSPQEVWFSTSSPAD